MSEDWLVRSPAPLDYEGLISALNSVIPHLALRSDATESAVVVVDSSDNPVVWILESRTVLEPVESAVILGLSTADPALGHWVEIVGATDRQAEGGVSPHDLLERVAVAIAEHTAGQATRWSKGAKPEPVMLDTDQAVSIAALAPRTDQPVDLVTESVAMWITSRPVIGLTAWLLFVQRWAQSQAKQCVVLTPAGTELTFAAEQFIKATGSLWIVDPGTNQTLFDGLTGADVCLEEESVVQKGSIHDGFFAADSDLWALTAEAETTHAYEVELALGAFAQRIAEAGGMPKLTGLSVVQPAEIDWDTEVFTAYAKQKSPGVARLLADGPGIQAMLTSVPQPVGLVESCVLAARPEPDIASRDTAESFAAGAISAGAQIAVLAYRRRTELNRVPSRFCGPNIPLAAVFRRDRFPTLSDAEALRIGGPNARLVQEPAPALVVTFDLQNELDPDQPHPAEMIVLIMEGLNHHDAHVQAARGGEET